MELKNKEVVVRKLEVKTDERGWLTEILRGEDVPTGGGFGQFFITTANPGIVKGNHYHTRKSEWFCAIQGDGSIIIENNHTGARDEIPFGENNLVCVAVPPHHTHALKNTGDKPLLVLIYISEPFNPEDPDTFVRKIL